VRPLRPPHARPPRALPGKHRLSPRSTTTSATGVYSTGCRPRLPTALTRKLRRG
jgi:hypothetical protein